MMMYSVIYVCAKMLHFKAKIPKKFPPPLVAFGQSFVRLAPTYKLPPPQWNSWPCHLNLRHGHTPFIF